MKRRQLLRTSAIATLTATLSGSALLGCVAVGGPGTVTLSEAELNTLLARRFPLSQRVMEVADVNASAPRLTLLPERRRLALAVTLAMRERLLGKRFGGQLAFDSALRIEPSDMSLRLRDVQVQSLVMDGPAGAAADAAGGLANRVARMLAERVLEDMVIYTVDAPRAARLRQAGLAPTEVNITSHGVELTVAPASAASRSVR